LAQHFIATVTGASVLARRNAATARDDRLQVGRLGGAVLISVPFLFPLAAGPSVNAWQLLAAWFCAALVSALNPIRRPARALAVWLGLTGALLAAGHPSSAGIWLTTCIAVAMVAVMASVGAGFADCPAPRFAFAIGLLAAGLISALLGLAQYYGLAEHLEPLTTAPDIGQAYGNLRQRNQFATLLNMALIALLWLYGSTIDQRWRSVLTASAVLLLVGQAASTSRTGLLQLIVIASFGFYMAHRERRPSRASRAGREAFRLPQPWLLLSLIPLYFLIGWLLPHLTGGGVEGIAQRLREGAPPGHSRLVLWSNVLTLIAHHPFAGWGWGELSFAHYMTLYDGPRFVEILDNAHNLPLHLAVELGIPAAVLICGGFAWLVIAARPWRERDPARLMAWGVLGVIVLHSLLEYPLWYGPFQLVFGLCLGLLWPAVASVRTTPKRPRMRALLAVVAMLLIAAIGYAGWDYTRISQIYLERDHRLSAYRDDTLAKIRPSWLFANQVRFAELTLTPVTARNAAEVHAMAEQALHFSPEPRVITKLIDSARLLGLGDEADAQATRFKIAFPEDYARWLAGKPPADASTH
jgi:O-antigen ligase